MLLGFPPMASSSLRRSVNIAMYSSSGSCHFGSTIKYSHIEHVSKIGTQAELTQTEPSRRSRVSKFLHNALNFFLEIARGAIFLSVGSLTAYWSSSIPFEISVSFFDSSCTDA